MIHYSCDMCKCELDPKHDTTFVVRMEMYPVPCEADAETDSDRDHLSEIQEVLERYDEFESDGLLPEIDAFLKRRFHFCRSCSERFAQQAMGRRGPRQFDFSKR